MYILIVLRYLVATGWPTDNGVKTEILDLSDPTKSCLLDDISVRGASTGGLLGTTPVICGGYDGSINDLSECLFYGTSQVISMNFKRRSHSSVAINSSMHWIMGGYKAGGYNGKLHLDSTEFITTGGAINGPTLPEGVSHSCAVKFPDTGDVYLAGGLTYHTNRINNVWVSNPSNEFTFTQGPSLITARFEHACGTMSIGAKSIIVAVGGYDSSDNLLASVEILDPMSNQWVVGKMNI